LGLTTDLLDKFGTDYFSSILLFSLTQNCKEFNIILLKQKFKLLHLIKEYNKSDGKPTFRKKLNNKLNKSFSSFEDLENQAESVSYVDFI